LEFGAGSIFGLISPSLCRRSAFLLVIALPRTEPFMNCSSGKRSSGPRVPAAAGPPSAHAILSRVTSRTGVANAVVDEGGWMRGSAPALQALSQQNGTNRRARRCCGQHAFDPGRFMAKTSKTTSKTKGFETLWAREACLSESGA
jgi:hypothetical protein